MVSSEPNQNALTQTEAYIRGVTSSFQLDYWLYIYKGYTVRVCGSCTHYTIAIVIVTSIGYIRAIGPFILVIAITIPSVTLQFNGFYFHVLQLGLIIN